MKKTILLFLILGGTFWAAAQNNCTISGPTTVCTGKEIVYSTSCPYGAWNIVHQQLGNGTTLHHTFTSAGTFLLQYSYIDGNETGQGSLSITVSASPNVPVISADAGPSICETRSIAFSVSNVESGVTYEWYSNPSGYSGTGTSLTASSVNQTTEFFVVATKGSCTWESSKLISYEVTGSSPAPKPASFYHKRIIEPTLSLENHYWQTSVSGTEILYPAIGERTVTEPGPYYIRKYASDGDCWTVATGPVAASINYTPYLAVISLVQRGGYTDVVFTHSDKEHVLTFADYYWVADASSSPTIVSQYNDHQEILISRVFQGGTYYLKGKDRGTGTWGPTLTVSIEIRGDAGLNYTESKMFDGTSENVIVSHSRSYFDEAGSMVQSQAKHISENHVFATQVLRDKLNRQVGSTLPAPLANTEFVFNEAFFLNPLGNPYNQDDFDYVNPEDPNDNTKYNPLPVSDEQPGSLGWYYSANNNLEPNVGKTQFPYSRTEYYEDGTGEVKRNASPGDFHRLGMTHEVLSGSFPVYDELTEYLGFRNTAISGICPGSCTASSEWNGVQTVVRDENGKYSISIADKQGKTVMTARKGSSANGDHTLTVGNSISVSGQKLLYFYLLNDEAVTLTGSTDFIAEDIVSETKKSLGATFAGQNGKWPAGFYKINLLSGSLTLAYTNYFQDVAYRYYDDAGRLVVSVSPNGYKELTKLTNPVAFSDIDKTTYTYNHRGWLLQMKEPDAGITNYQYRSDGKIRFSQNAEQCSTKFSYTRYDHLGRPTESGEYKGATSFGNLTGQLEYVGQVDYAYNDVIDKVRTYYDVPDNNFYTETGLPSSGSNVYTQRFVRGAVSYTDNANNKTWYSYDELGRVVWMAQKPKALSFTFVASYTYDFLGHVLTTASLQYQNGQLKSAFYHHYEYDADQRLAAAYTSLDGIKRKLRATYHYYLHGPLKRIELGGRTQGIDFVYNINGWLTSINHPNNAEDPGQDGLSGSIHSNYRKDAFGMSLDYYESEMEDLFPTAMLQKDIRHPQRHFEGRGKTILEHPGEEIAQSQVRELSNPNASTRRALERYLVREADAKRGYSSMQAALVENLTPPISSDNAVTYPYEVQAQSGQLNPDVIEHMEFPDVQSQEPARAENELPEDNNVEEQEAVVSGDPSVEPETMHAPPPPDPVDVVWTYATGVTVSGNSITRSASGNGWGAAGASSVNILAPFTDGWVEMTEPSEVGMGKMFGLAAYDPDLNYTSINFAFYINGNIWAYENGSSKGVVSGGSAVAGDVLRIERVGPFVHYKRNGNVVYTSLTASTSHLIVDAAIYNLNSRIYNVRTSFGTGEIALNPVWVGVTGSTESNGTLVKTATSGDNNAGAWSSNQLGAGKNGWIQYTVNQTGKLSFGFSDSNANDHWNTIDYGITIESNGVTVINNGSTPATTAVATNDIFRIERSGSSILVKKNATTIHTFTSVLTSALYVDVSLIDNGATLTGLKTSFWISPAEGLVPDIHELKALKQVYDSLGGVSWTTKTNWPAAGSWPSTATAATMDAWHGIYAIGGDIKYIQLGSNNLIGKLPASISLLTSLTRLEIHSNKVNSAVPIAIGDLIGLTVLYLHNNDLTGSLPTSMANLKMLTNLDLRNNLFTGTFPQFLGQLTRLQALYLGDNRTTGFTGSIPDLSELSSVTNLIIRGNPNLNLTPFPYWLGSIPQLTTLLWSNNHHYGALPESWRALTNLTELDLSYNAVSELPSWIGDLNDLVTLTIQHAGMTGQIPASIGQLTNLQQLYLANNQLSGSIPAQINNATKLKLIYLYLNILTGEIPNMSGLVDLETVNMRDNFLTGSIGSWIGSLTKLKVWHIDDNYLTSIAPEILQLPLMTTLNFSFNKLTSIPNFYNYSNKANLNLYVGNNYLDFSDLEPLFGSGTHGIKTFTYSPQLKFTFQTKKHVPTNSLFELTAQPKGQYSAVTWEKQNGASWTNMNSTDEDATLQTYKISSITASNNGTYRWKMTNTRVTGLTIECDPIAVLAVDALPTQPGGGALFNGLIASARWKGEVPYGMDLGTTPQAGMYLYKYDDRHQVTEANWAEPNETLNTYVLSANRFRITNLAYDPNGNINSLNRYDADGNRIHNFSYTYDANKNRLRTVSGYVNSNGYDYNNLGQLIKEDKVTGPDQYIQYDVTGKVRKVYSAAPTPSSIPKVEFLYDDRGFRIAKYSVPDTLTTWYIRDGSGTVLSIFEQKGAPEQSNANPLVMIEVPVYGSSKLGTYYPREDGSTVYEVTDHLGNVRALVRDNVSIYTATMEHTGSEDFTDPRMEEMQYFENLFETEVDDSHMNHTSPVATPETNPDKSAYLYWVDGMSGMSAVDKSVGPAIALKVSAGDTVNMETWVRYQNKVSYSRNMTLAALASYLGSSYAYTGGFEALNVSQTTTSLNTALTAAGFMADGSITDRPFAYLNYIVYNSSMAMVTAGWQRADFGGFDPGQEMIYDPNTGLQIDPEVGFGHLTFESPIPIGQDGYIYVWVSNESEATKVWFDDLTVNHSHKIVVQSSDFGVWGELLRQQTIVESVYRYGYQGQFAEKDSESGWNHFDLRQYDPTIARWTSVDPKRLGNSPYIGMNNNPVSGTDPDGGGPIEYDVLPDGTQVYRSDKGGSNVDYYNYYANDTEGNAGLYYTGTTAISRSLLGWLQLGFSSSKSMYLGITIEVDRFQFTDNSTISTFTLDEETGYFMEPAWDPDLAETRGSDRAVSPGTYNLVPHVSCKYAHGKSIRLVGVPGRVAVLIHPGRLPGHTEGCLLPGCGIGTDQIQRNTSQRTFDMIWNALNNNRYGGRVIINN